MIDGCADIFLLFWCTLSCQSTLSTISPPDGVVDMGSSGRCKSHLKDIVGLNWGSWWWKPWGSPWWRPAGQQLEDPACSQSKQRQGSLAQLPKYLKIMTLKLLMYISFSKVTELVKWSKNGLYFTLLIIFQLRTCWTFGTISTFWTNFS